MLTRIGKRSQRLARLVKELEVQFKWWLTWIVFFLLHRSWPKHGESVDPKRARSVLFLRYDRIGDMIVSLPTFHVLKQQYPHLQIDILASPANQMIVAQDDLIRDVYIYNKGSLRETWRSLRRLHRQSYDVTVDLVANVSATSLFILLMAGRDSFKIGVRKNNSVDLYDFIIPEQQMRTIHAVKLHFAALRPFGIDPDFSDNDNGIRLSPEQWRLGETLVEQLRNPEQSGLVGINISAGKPNREWGVDKYRAFVGELSRRHPKRRFVIFSSPSDHPQAQTIADEGEKNVAVIPAGLSLLDVIAMIRHLDLMMSPDTSICHVASSLRVPLLGLFTAAEENFARWRPYRQPSWVVRPPQGDSLEGISVQDYLEKAEEALNTIFRESAVR
jgi:ADP-heptose:LPS heptosyltransferase